MGMYTQIRGFIEVGKRLSEDEVGFFSKPYIKDFENIKKEFHKTWGGDRAELATSTSCYNCGSDWEHFIFFGGSIKDYSEDLRGWIDFVLSKYKNCDGKIELQYEENNFYWLLTIKDSKIINEESISLPEDEWC